MDFLDTRKNVVDNPTDKQQSASLGADHDLHSSGDLIGPPPLGGNRFTGWLGRSVLKITGWQIQGELPQYKKMVIAVAPHTSNWDFFLGVAVLFALRIKIKFLGKHSIFVPPVKTLLKRIGGIPVDRRSAHGVVNQIAMQFAQSEQMILAVAPEGTRSAIYPWKSGFLCIAQESQVPVQLVAFDFKFKRVIIEKVLHPSNNRDDDMRLVYDYFSTINAKYPEKLVTHS